MLHPFDRFRRSMRLSQRPRSAEEKFRDFLAYGLGVRVSDYERMDKELQAVINDKYAYVFLRSPLEERIREFFISPHKPNHCHAPGCEWRESELTGFGIWVRRCVRCEHYQLRPSHGPGAVWHDITRDDYEFLVLRDEAHRAQWDTVPSHLATTAGSLNFDHRDHRALAGTNGDSKSMASQNEFDTAPMR